MNVTFLAFDAWDVARACGEKRDPLRAAIDAVRDEWTAFFSVRPEQAVRGTRTAVSKGRSACAGVYRAADPIALAWHASTDVVALLRTLAWLDRLDDDFLDACLLASLPTWLFARVRTQIHFAHVSPRWCAVVRRLTDAPTFDDVIHRIARERPCR